MTGKLFSLLKQGLDKASSWHKKQLQITPLSLLKRSITKTHNKMKLKISIAFIFVAFFSGIQISAQRRSKVLPVPYKVQPTSYTCQSTCLKMMGMYEGFPFN